jgi:phage tail sheath gpL-like
MTGSPRTVLTAVVDGDDASAIAGKMRTALAADADVAAYFDVSGATDKIILTVKLPVANDATMNIATNNATSIGITPEATSADTTAGVAQGTYGCDIAAITGGLSIQGSGGGNSILPENIWITGAADGILLDVFCSQL